jgi:malonyl-CoA decarboxylase
MNVSFLQDLLGTIVDRGRAIIDQPARAPAAPESLESRCRALLSTRGEASGMALASEIVGAYSDFDEEQRLRFFEFLKAEFDPDRERLKEAAVRYAERGEPQDERALLVAAESRR